MILRPPEHILIPSLTDTIQRRGFPTMAVYINAGYLEANERERGVIHSDHGCEYLLSNKPEC